MKYYEKSLPNIYTHKPHASMLEHLKIKTENEYLSNMLSNSVDEYEFIVNDIISGNDITVDGKTYRCIEIKNEL